MLRVTGLQVALQRLPVLRGIALTIGPGEIVGLLGRNGAGKTTTLRSIMGLVTAADGEITLGDENLLAMPAHARAAAGIGYLPEDRRLVPSLTVENNIMLPAWANRLSDAADRLERIYAHMPEVREFRARTATQLSGGQQKLVGLARALMAGRRLLLLDEPFEGLAPALTQRMGAVIEAFQAEGVGVLLTESEQRHVDQIANRTYTIERGAIASETANSPKANSMARTE